MSPNPKEGECQNMQCLEATELMSLHLDAATTAEEERALQEHLASCEDCRALMRRMERASALFEKPAFVAPSPLFAQKVMQRIERRNRWLALWRTVALSVVGGVVLVAVCLAPLMSLTAVAQEVVTTPSMIHVLVGSAMRVVDILDTLLRATRLIFYALVASPSGLILLALVVALGVLSACWVRLMTRHSAPTGMTTRVF
jgi:hypothetical protein